MIFQIVPKLTLSDHPQVESKNNHFAALNVVILGTRSLDDEVF